MRRVVSLYRSSVGKKILMALSGLILIGFLIAHMAGNLKIFWGPDSFNGYAEWLRGVGYPLLPHMAGLWMVRILLLLAVVIHVIAAVQLWRMSQRARRHGYQREKSLAFSYASRTMRWGGVILLLFIVYHILHFTTGHAYFSGEFVKEDVYGNFIRTFRNPLVLGVYVVAQAALCLHLYHGTWSVFQTLGANHPKYNRWRRPLAAVLALVLFIGFIVPPILVMAGVVGAEVPSARAAAPVLGQEG